jgi:hypothetical protein
MDPDCNALLTAGQRAPAAHLSQRFAGLGRGDENRHSFVYGGAFKGHRQTLVYGGAESHRRTRPRYLYQGLGLQFMIKWY